MAEAEAHHARHVLRVGVGDEVVVLDGAGQELRCAVREIGKRSVVLEVRARTRHPPVGCQITLWQAVTRTKSMDWILQKATELGVGRVVPVLTGRGVAQVRPDEAGEKARKWTATVVEAIKQSGWPWLPVVTPPARIGDVLGQATGCELGLVASLGAGARHPRAYLDAFMEERGRGPESIGVWVGPEGDFTPEEIEAIQGSGAYPITLGPNVLRSETAAIYCLSVLRYEAQRFTR